MRQTNNQQIHQLICSLMVISILSLCHPTTPSTISYHMSTLTKNPSSVNPSNGVLPSNPQSSLYVSALGNFFFRNSKNQLIRMDRTTGLFEMVYRGSIRDASIHVRYEDETIHFTKGNCLWRVERNESVLVAGTGSVGYSGDGGPALNATFSKYVYSRNP